MKTFASELERRRLAAGLAQDQLASEAGVSRSTVQNAERGQRVSARSVRRMAERLQWPVLEAMTLIKSSKAPRSRVSIFGDTADRLRAAADAAGKGIDDYVAELLGQPAASGKRKQ